MFKLVFTYLDCLGGGVAEYPLSPPGAAQTQIKSSRWELRGEGGGEKGEECCMKSWVS